MLAFGLQVTVIGFGIVLIALAALMFFIQGATSFLVQKKTEPKVNAAPQAAAPAPVAAAPVQKDDNELTAVIAAAIAACGHQVVVKSITRVMGTNGAAWSAMGRTEAMNLRQL